jgi:hypothetical protein
MKVKRLGFWHKRTRKTEKENKKWEKIDCLTVRDSLKKGEKEKDKREKITRRFMLFR